MFAATIALTALLSLAPQETPLGKPCPKLDLAYAMQGEAFTLDDLRGRVAVLDFLALDADDSWSVALAASARLAAQYAKDERLAIGAIASTPGSGPPGAKSDDAEFRQKLAEKRFVVPVMRDRKGDALALIAPGAKAASPYTIVLDGDGVVRFAGPSGSETASAEISKVVVDLLARFWVDPIPDLPHELAAYANNDLPVAGAAARQILSNDLADPKLRAAAEAVTQNLEAGAKKLLDAGIDLRKSGFPARATRKLENAGRIFGTTPAAITATKTLQQWREDAIYKRELAGERQLDAATRKLKFSRERDARSVAKLEELLTQFADTALVPRIKLALDSLH